jgi:hypothetical protein
MYKMSSMSVQEMVRPSEAMDLYYYDAETSKKQAFATTQNTKYVQQFANLTGGSSVFTIPPQNGIQDIVVNASFAPLSAGAVADNYSLPAGWLWALVRQVSFRYGGSSQYFISGQQLLQNALRCQTSRSSCDDLLNLGGNFATGAALNSVQSASIVLRLPHNVCSGVGKSHPLPTDCLTQQVQVTVELFSPGQIWTNLSGQVLPASCQALSQAQFQVQQVMFNNQGDALARRVDLATKAYAFPCEFVQQETLLPLVNTTAPQNIVLTGFRSGEVKSIEVWLTNNADTAQSSPGGGSASGYSSSLWYPPTSVEMLYAGDIYARYDNGVGQLFNLINGNKSPAFDNIMPVPAAGAVTPVPELSQWLSLPFAQTLVDEDAHYILVHGKPITNGIVNLNNVVIPFVSVPKAGQAAGSAGWTMHISYVYNTTLLFSQGTCDYVF